MESAILGQPVDMVSMLNRAAKVVGQDLDFELQAELTVAAQAVANVRDGRCSMEGLAAWWGFEHYKDTAEKGGVE